MQESIIHCNLNHVPQSIRRVLDTGCWRERFSFETQQIWKFNSFAEFLTKPLGQGGCDFTREQVEKLLVKADDSEVLRMFRAAMDAQELNARTPDLKAHGGKRQKQARNEKDVTRLRSVGDTDTAAYAIARLRKDRPAIHARVLAGEITPHAGMIEAGFRKRSVRNKLSRVDRTWKRMQGWTQSERQEIKARLDREFP